jgi:hypothetical protein
MHKQAKPWQQLQGRWANGKKAGRARRGPQNPQQQHILMPLEGGILVPDGVCSPANLCDIAGMNSQERRWLWRNIYKHFSGDTSTRTWRNPEEAAEAQARWDENRMLRRTAPALGATRRLGRL